MHFKVFYEKEPTLYSQGYTADLYVIFFRPRPPLPWASRKCGPKRSYLTCQVQWKVQIITYIYDRISRYTIVSNIVLSSIIGMQLYVMRQVQVM